MPTPFIIISLPMRTIKLLDVTLRDGGYVNNWQFGEDATRLILNKLNESGIELIEAGFISQKEPASAGRTIYPSFEAANAQVAHLADSAQVACMINYGAYSADDIPSYHGKGVGTIRVAFHSKDLHGALHLCEQIAAKGYKVFVQPMATTGFTEDELEYLMTSCNQFVPEAVYIVDSFGTMQREDVLRLLRYYDAHLNEGISIGFHSHNNLQLAFPNAQEILRADVTHNLIIDSSVFGMGRGAGNLCTELIAMFLNEHYNKNYQLVPILEIIDTCLNAIFIKTPWGYSVPYYVAAINQCHPNYATYLLNKQTLGVQQINIILSQIPRENKRSFDPSLAEKVYLEYQARSIDDTDTLTRLKDYFSGRPLLLLAPGKSITTHHDQIESFIRQKQPRVVAINFIPNGLPMDTLFLSNTKRFASMKELEDLFVIATSNIPAQPTFRMVNYTSLINPGHSETDNAGLMLLRLLQKLGFTDIHFAGYDGFDVDIHENYYDDQLINNTITEIFVERNKSVSEQLQVLMKTMQIHFLTPTRYVH